MVPSSIAVTTRPPPVGEHARKVRVGQFAARFDLGGERIDDGEAADDAGIVDVAAAAELAAHMGGRIGRDIGAAFARADIEELALVGEDGGQNLAPLCTSGQEFMIFAVGDGQSWL